ncbi:MAG: hypothetical protein ISR82_02680 [Candidatus Marinimicrobia bacterium]|nr:hypothetical protein [Candidatus Neomarinimicrobiota bacterium]MBL7010109.1 hypothetical protein [Candidatus Neomarinimicrobiota bacterium]
MKQNIGDFIPEHIVLLDCLEFGAQSRLKIIIDGKEPVDLSTTAKIARNVRDSGLLDSIYPEGVQLEVTSPGVDAPLVHPIQFEKNMGRQIQLIMLGDSEPTQVEICQVTDKGFDGKFVNGTINFIQFDEIESAKVKIRF